MKHQVIAAAVFRIVAAGLSFGFMAVVARSIGVANFGEFSVLVALINIGVVVALLGHEILATRIVGSISAYSTEAHQRVVEYIAGATRHALTLGFLGSFFLAVFICARLSKTGSVGTMESLALLIPVVSLIRVNQGIIRGAHQPVRALLADGIVRPGCALLLFPILLFCGVANLVSLSVAMLIGGFLALLVSWVQRDSALYSLLECKPVHKAEGQAVSAPREEPGNFSLAIYCSSILAVAASQMGVVLVGTIGGPEEAASYSVAQRYSIATALVAQGIYQAVGAQIASRYFAGDLNGLRRLIRRVSRATAMATLVCVIGVSLGGNALLGLFGDEYRGSTMVLNILLCGVMANVAAGPVGALLLMTGNERKHFWALLLSVLTQGAGLTLLVPHFGAEGAALAAFVSIIAWNGIMMIHVHRKIGFSPFLLFA